MRRLVLILFWLTLAPGVLAGPSKIMKVLPHLLDQQGRHTLAPSLFERDAYQAELRQHPERVGGLRLDVQWKHDLATMATVKLRLELRGSKNPRVVILEQAMEKRRWYQRWTAFTLDREAHQQLGELVAWRATLWDGDRQLAELKSFLW